MYGWLVAYLIYLTMASSQLLKVSFTPCHHVAALPSRSIGIPFSASSSDTFIQPLYTSTASKNASTDSHLPPENLDLHSASVPGVGRGGTPLEEDPAGGESMVFMLLRSWLNCSGVNTILSGIVSSRSLGSGSSLFMVDRGLKL